MYGKKIRTLRVLRGYSQEDMCKELKLDTSKYSRIETDTQKPSAELLEQIAMLLGVTIADIMCNEPVIIQASGINHNLPAEKESDFNYLNQKELYEKIIALQKEEIERLVKNEERLIAMLENRK